MQESSPLRRRIRENYDQQPYPGRGRKNRSYPVPVEWMRALLRPGRRPEAPGRILVAGCGTGAEAFGLRRRFPEAEIVAFDFSPESIAIATELQRGRRGRRVRFLVADLGAPGLARRVGRGFDLVSCHGVLTYVPDPRRALSGLARCLADDGALYLGVNGSGHISVQLRQAIAAFGMDRQRFVDTPLVRELLAWHDTLRPPVDRVGRASPEYLASDVFGAFFQNLPLASWVRCARRAGLYVHGNSTTYVGLRSAVQDGRAHLLMPRSRIDASIVLDILQPRGFYRLTLSTRRPDNPPWDHPRRLLAWRPILTGLFRPHWPAGQAARRPSTARRVVFTSTAMNTHLTVDMPGWQVALFRHADGVLSIEEILVRAGFHPRADELVRPLYDLFQLAVCSLLPPGSS